MKGLLMPGFLAEEARYREALDRIALENFID